jgi:DNA-binding NarL/FixJ family response regulator
MIQTRILVADDHTLVLEAVSYLLEDEFAVVGKVNDASLLLQEVERLKPGVIVAAVPMGFEAVRWVRECYPATRVVFLSMSEDPALAAEGFRLGAFGWVLKTSPVDELLQGVREAAQGRRFLTRRIAKGEITALPSDTAPAGAGQLTPRERQGRALLVEGKSMQQVAGTLGITRRTVAFHKYRMMESLGIRTSTELLKFAMTSGVGTV